MATVLENDVGQAFQPDISELSIPQAEVRRDLGDLASGLRRHLAVRGLAWVIGTAILLAAGSLAIDRWLRLDRPTRGMLLVLGLVALAWVAWRRLVRPLRLRWNDLDLAFLLDRRLPGVGQRIANVLELPGLLAGRGQASPAMVRAAVLADTKQLSRQDWHGVLDGRRHRRRLAVLAALGVCLVLAILLAPGVVGLWSRRFFLLSHERWPQHNWLTVVGAKGGTLLAARGEPLVVQIAADPAFKLQGGRWSVAGRDDVLLPKNGLRPEPRPPERVTLRWQADDGETRRGIFERISENRFRYELPAVVGPLEVSIAGGDDWLAPLTVRPVDRPAIERLVIHAVPPGGIGEPRTYTVGESQLLFLPRTELTLRLAANTSLRSARLVSKTTSESPSLKRAGDRKFVARWKMREALTLEIQLVGGDGNLPSKPSFVSIGLLADRAPRVTLRASGVGRRITPQARVPSAIRALDDFGLSALAIEAECTRASGDESPAERSSKALELPAGSPPTDAEQQQEIAVADYHVTPGTLLRLRAVAADNCVEGAQQGVSRWLALQVVSPEELFFEILLRQRAERARFAAAVETAKTVLESLAVLPKSEEARALLRKHQAMSRQTGQVAARLEAILTELALNELGSPAARDLLESEIISPIGQLASGPLADLPPLLEGLEAAPARLESARGKQQEIVNQMEAILARMQQWESFVDVLNQLREVIKLQTEVVDGVENKRKTQAEGVFDDEEEGEEEDIEAADPAEPSADPQI